MGQNMARWDRTELPLEDSLWLIQKQGPGYLRVSSMRGKHFVFLHVVKRRSLTSFLKPAPFVLLSLEMPLDSGDRFCFVFDAV